MDTNRIWTSYYQKALNISIKVPVGWDIGQNEDFHVIIIAPEENGFRENVGLNMYDFEGGNRNKFESAIQSAQKNLESEYNDYKKESEMECWIDGFPAYHQQYTWLSDQNIRYSQSITLIFFPDRLYEINGTTIADPERTTDNLLEEIITSVRFINK